MALPQQGLDRVGMEEQSGSASQTLGRHGMFYSVAARPSLTLDKTDCVKLDHRFYELRGGQQEGYHVPR